MYKPSALTSVMLESCSYTPLGRGERRQVNQAKPSTAVLVCMCVAGFKSVQMDLRRDCPRMFNAYLNRLLWEKGKAYLLGYENILGDGICPSWRVYRDIFSSVKVEQFIFRKELPLQQCSVEFSSRLHNYRGRVALAQSPWVLALPLEWRGPCPAHFLWHTSKSPPRLEQPQEGSCCSAPRFPVEPSPPSAPLFHFLLFVALSVILPHGTPPPPSLLLSFPVFFSVTSSCPFSFPLLSWDTTLLHSQCCPEGQGPALKCGQRVYIWASLGYWELYTGQSVWSVMGITWTWPSPTVSSVSRYLLWKVDVDARIRSHVLPPSVSLSCPGHRSLQKGGMTGHCFKLNIS